ncbi:MAG: DUF368 domain-containing protein [Firmicutes bacterium]|nr:DUF368 domain-containing protein [Bacillota bacterium]
MFIELMVKGFIIGIAFIIPGVSGGTLAIYLGVYDKLLQSIGNIFKEFKKSVAYLFPIFLGIGLSVVVLAKLLGFLIQWNSFITLLFFIGLIFGGIPSILKKVGKENATVSGYLAFFIAFGIVLLLLMSQLSQTGIGIAHFDMTLMNFLLLILLGAISSITMIVPGISGSALLMALGFYTAIVTNVIGNVFDFSVIGYNLYVIIPFAIGAALGIILFSKVIVFFLKEYPKETYLAIVGFILASVVVIFLEIRDPSTGGVFTDQLPIYNFLWNFIKTNVLSVIFGVLSLVLGVFSATLLVKLEFKLKKNES